MFFTRIFDKYPDGRYVSIGDFYFMQLQAWWQYYKKRRLECQTSLFFPEEKDRTLLDDYTRVLSGPPGPLDFVENRYFIGYGMWQSFAISRGYIIADLQKKEIMLGMVWYPLYENREEISLLYGSDLRFNRARIDLFFREDTSSEFVGKSVT